MTNAEKSELLRWFEELVRTRYGTMKALAEVADRGAGALTRSAAQTGSIGLEPLLRLAADLGESPSKVLKIAKKDDMDALIRRLYGRPSVTLPADVQSVVDFLLLEDERFASVQAWIKRTAQEWQALLPPPAPTPAPGAGKRGAMSDMSKRTGAPKR